MAEERPRSHRGVLWVFVALAVLGLAVCAVIVVALGVGLATTPLFHVGFGTGVQETATSTYNVGPMSNLQVDDFAGNLTVRTGGSGVIQVVATKKASSSTQLAQIQVNITPQDGGVVIKTTKSLGFSSGSVNLDITIPADTRVTAHTGAGNVEVQGVSVSVSVDTGAGNVQITNISGPVDAHTGAGNINVQGTTANVRAQTGAGNVQYSGTPQGTIDLETGAGNVEAAIPANANVQVNLTTGLGNVNTTFSVSGQVNRQSVVGTIGSGQEGTITAHSGIGNVDLRRQ